MFKSINVEAENLELILENSNGDKVIIPANKRNWVKQKLSEGCHDCIDSLVETLPVASQYAQDGSVYPPNTKVKVNENNQIKEYDISSPEYKNLYDSGKLMSYDKNTDTYIATPLKEVIITAEAPQWLKDKRKYESQYSRDWYIDNIMPKFSRGMGISANNMHPNNIKEYDSYINDKVVEDIFKRKPTFDNDYSNDRLKTLQGFSQKELELIKNSKYASKIEPSIWSKFEQGLLSVGNAGSPVTFKNENLTQKEAKKEDNPLNILQPLSVPSKMVQSVYKKDYSLKDALKGKQNNAGIVEDIVTDPLNLVGLGIWSKLSKANKFAKLEDAYQAIKTLDKTTLEKQIGTTLSNDDWQYLYRVQEKGLSKEEQLNKLNQLANNPNWNKYISQEEKVERILSKKDKIKNVTLKENQLSIEEKLNPFSVEDTGKGEDYKDIISLIKGKNNPEMTYESFENAAKTWASKRNDELAGTMDNLGRASHNNYWGISNDFKGLPEDADILRKVAYDKYYKNVSPEQKKIIEEHIKNHELDHFLYKQSRAEYDELIKAFDPEKFGLSKKYLVGRKSTIAGDELRARMGQLMDYFQFKINPKTGQVEDVLGNTKFTKEHLEYAMKNYIKDTKLDNNMIEFFNGIKNKELFVKLMNEKALGVIPVITYFQSQQNNKTEQ